MMRGKVLAAVAAIVVSALVAPAQAGVRKDYEPQGVISLRVFRVEGREFLNPAGQTASYTGDVLEVKINVATGQYRPGNLELRVDGIVVSKFTGSPYRKAIPLGWPLMPDKSLGAIPGQENVAPINLLDGADYTLEAYFTVRDQRGREVSSKSAAPTATFSVAAKTVSPLELAARVKQAIDEALTKLRAQHAADEGKWREALERLRKDKLEQQARYDKELKRFADELNAHKQEAEVPKPSIAVMVDGKPVTERSVTVDNSEADVNVSLTGADRYLVIEAGVEKTFAKNDLSIRFCKGIEASVRVFAFIGDTATEIIVKTKGADSK